MQTTEIYFHERFIHEWVLFCENFVLLFGCAHTLNSLWKWHFGRKWQFSGKCDKLNPKYLKNHNKNEINLITDKKFNTYIFIYKKFKQIE
jgi:hypothetical protein